MSNISKHLTKIFTDWPILIISVLVFVGIVLGTLWSGAILAWSVALAVLSVLGLIFVITHRFKMLMIAIWPLIIVAGGLYVNLYHSLLPQLELGKTDQLRAVIDSIPQNSYKGQTAFIVTSNQPQARLKAIFKNNASLDYGDELILNGEIALGDVSSNFNEKSWLLANGAVGKITVDYFNVVDKQKGSRFLHQLYSLRSYLIRRVLASFKGDTATVLRGIILGDKSNLDQGLKEIFNKTGTSHILVASGSNVAIIAWIVGLMLITFSRGLSQVGSLGLICIFIFISGADASIIRASVFFVFKIIAEWIGYRIHFPTILFLVASTMAIINPWIILYDISFQLSFGAIAGLAAFTNYFVKVIKIWPLTEFLAPTLAAQLTTLPIIIYHFGSASLLSPLTNFLILPLVPLVMLVGLFAIVAGWFKPFVWITEGLVVMILGIIEGFARIDWGWLEFRVHNWWLVGALLGICLILWFKKKKKEAHGT